MIIGGLDPGNKGAIGVYNGATETLVDVIDLPNIQVIIGASKRWRLLEDEMHAMFVMLKELYDMQLLVIEQVMGMPKQSAPAAFQFGDTFGVIRTSARFAGLQLHRCSPTVWKLQEQVPNTPSTIVAKAEAEFPGFSHLWYGPGTGGKKAPKKRAFLHDRAEAAFLSRYGWRKIWPAVQPREKLRKAIKGAPKVAA